MAKVKDILIILLKSLSPTPLFQHQLHVISLFLLQIGGILKVQSLAFVLAGSVLDIASFVSESFSLCPHHQVQDLGCGIRKFFNSIGEIHIRLATQLRLEHLLVNAVQQDLVDWLILLVRSDPSDLLHDLKAFLPIFLPNRLRVTQSPALLELS